jgi:serine O-acetyltransferase
MLSELKADLARYPGSGLGRLICALRSPGFYPIAVYRFGHEVYFRWPAKLSIAGKIPYKLAAFLTEWATGIAISPDASIGPGLYIGHWGCTRIGRQVKMGSNCNISPMVVLGFGSREGKTGVPTLGDRVYVASGAKIIGPITIGSDVAVGTNAVVCRDVPDHVTVGGVPAKVISTKGSAPYLAVGQELDVNPAAEERDAVKAVRDHNEQVAHQGASKSA